MPAPQGTVRYRRYGQTLEIQAEGWATMPVCLPIRRLAEHHFADGVFELRMDLSRCAHLDSTFVGTMLFLKRVIDRRGHGQFALLSPSCQCRQVLQQMGVENIFPVALEDPAPCEWCDLRVDSCDTNSFRHNVVDAHCELATLDGPAGAAFREVALGMTRAMKQSEDVPQPRD
jgi:hypothetical protein